MPAFSEKIKQLISFLWKEDGSLKKKVIRSGFWVSASSIGLNILTLLRSVILARLLLPEVFGLMGLCLIIITGMELFSQTGFSAALINRQENFDDAKDTAFSILVIRGVILACITFIIAPFTASYYDREILDVLIKVIGISFILKGMENINVFGLEKNLNFKRITYFEQAKAFMDFIVIVTLVYLLRNIWGLVIGHVISSVVGAVLSYIVIPGRPHFRFDKTIAKELFNYGKFITGITIVLYIATELDKFLIGKLLGMEALGYYVLAFMLANLPSTHISKLVSRVMFPAYSRMQNDPEALRRTYLKVLKLVSSLAVPAAAGIATLAPEIIGIVYGEKWLPAVHVLQILCAFGGLRALASLNGYLCNGIGRPNVPFYFALIRMIILAVFLYPVTKNYDLIGAATLIFCPFIFEVFLGIYVLRRLIAIDIMEVSRILFSAIGCSIIMSVTLILIKGNMPVSSIYSLIFLVLSGMLTYLLLNYRYMMSFLKRNEI